MLVDSLNAYVYVCFMEKASTGTEPDAQMQAQNKALCVRLWEDRVWQVSRSCYVGPLSRKLGIRMVKH